MVNILYQTIKQPRKLFGNVNKNNVRNFEACFTENFFLQYSVFYTFVQGWNMQVCVHSVALPSPCLCFCASILSFISCKILFHVVCKAFRNQFGSIFVLLDSTNSPWLWMKKPNSLSRPGSMYVSPLNKHGQIELFTTFSRELPQRNMLIKIKILVLKLF